MTVVQLDQVTLQSRPRHLYSTTHTALDSQQSALHLFADRFFLPAFTARNLSSHTLRGHRQHISPRHSTPDMSFATNRKEEDGDFLLVVAGLTRFAPYLTGWQEFKDHIRRVVREQPGWVDVYASQSQRRGEMQGWCRLKDREDAEAAYSG